MEEDFRALIIPFYESICQRVLEKPLQEWVRRTLRRREVERAIEGLADEASEWLTRFCLNQQLTVSQVAGLIGDLERMTGSLKLANL
jgi:hypothetical protein